ncbi:MAG: peptide-methionine (S)-S-oxide reductase MsrA [Actinobacteria bacterium]|nr:peptide-methionine (S)-S-oxide reductase MsrA [Actinomycetota bacterium]
MTEKATFAAGCFWGVEAAFRQIDGVTGTRVGYTGGSDAWPDPTYKQVCAGRTGHAEAIEVEYDPERISYDELLEVFFGKHNPTTKNRQGWDIGSQYRSAIFTHSPEQEQSARAAIDGVQAGLHWPKKVVTEVAPATAFYAAEEYHQRYLEKAGRASCTVDLKAS